MRGWSAGIEIGTVRAGSVWGRGVWWGEVHRYFLIEVAARQAIGPTVACFVKRWYGREEAAARHRVYMHRFRVVRDLFAFRVVDLRTNIVRWLYVMCCSVERAS